MNNQQQTNISQIEMESLSREISQKSIIIARLQANLYDMTKENTKLKKKLKSSSKSKDASNGK